MTCTFPNCDCVRDNPPLCKKSSIHAIYPTKAGFGETQRLYTEAELQAAIARAEQAETQVVELEAALVAAHEMRKAADRVSEWFCTEASHLEGPRIQALRACMLAYDRQMWLFTSTTLSQGNGE